MMDRAGRFDRIAIFGVACLPRQLGDAGDGRGRMTPDVRPLVAGNWKMNGTRASLDEIKAIAEGVEGPLSEKVDTVICPPVTLLYVATALCTDSPLQIGAQDCHQNAVGRLYRRDLGRDDRRLLWHPCSSAIPSAAPIRPKPIIWSAPRQRRRMPPA